jgi:hypothetical protein
MAYINKTFFSKKTLIQIYFIFFIILNILDFINYLPGDFDFFKKILSWVLIGYIFYRVSFTKIFIGERLKRYDIAFILSFCFFVIPKSLLHYTAINTINSNTFPIFHSFIELLIPELNSLSPIYLQSTFLVGFILTIILSIILYLNHEPQKKSFLGSFNFAKDSYFKHVVEIFLLTFILLFFGLIIFNFFMEWFALAVDSIILVLGLIYYIFMYIHNHTTNKISSILQKISNSGNEFYKNLITLFADKKTIFIGISFLLTLHLLVDIGVYMVPYTLGTQNTLYFEELNSYDSQTNTLREHNPLFNLYNFDKSVFYKDMQIAKNDIFFILILFTIYLSSVFLIILLLLMPFYLFYKNTRKKNINIKKSIVIIFLSSLILFGLLYFLNGLNPPIQFDATKALSVRGVDFYTSSIFGNNNSIYTNDITYFNLLISIISFFTFLIIFMLTYDKFQKFYIKSFYIIILLFFIIYIGIFYTSYASNEFSAIQHFSSNFDKSSFNYGNYSKVQSIYLNSSNYKFPNFITIFENNPKIEVKPFSTLKSESGTYFVEKAENHDDYLYVEISNYNEKLFEVSIQNSSRIFFNENYYDESKKVFIQENISFIYYLGKNYFDIKKRKYGELYEINTTMNQGIINEMLDFEAKTKKFSPIQANLQKLIEQIRLLFTSLFYILGTIAFSFFYVKKNLFNRDI